MSVRFEMKATLQEYLDAGDHNTKEYLADPDFSAALHRAYDFFTRDLLVNENGLRAPASFLAVNAFLIWMSSVRMALTGHAAATYPLFRTAVESACYARIVQKDEAKEAIWLARNRSDKDRVACRAAFTPAAKEVAKAINEIQAGSGDIIMELYESAIDYGAHPNTKSVMSHIRSEADTDEKYWRMQLVGVHHHGAKEAGRALIASLECAWVVGLIVFRTIDEPNERQAKALEEMHALKEKVLGEWFEIEPMGGTPAA